MVKIKFDKLMSCRNQKMLDCACCKLLVTNEKAASFFLASVSSSTLGPLMLGLFGVPVLVIGSAVVSLLICRGSARTFFSSSLPHQPLVESRYSSILRLDCNEDDNDLIDTS